MVNTVLGQVKQWDRGESHSGQVKQWDRGQSHSGQVKQRDRVRGGGHNSGQVKQRTSGDHGFVPGSVAGTY